MSTVGPNLDNIDLRDSELLGQRVSALASGVPLMAQYSKAIIRSANQSVNLFHGTLQKKSKSSHRALSRCPPITRAPIPESSKPFSVHAFPLPRLPPLHPPHTDIAMQRATAIYGNPFAIGIPRDRAAYQRSPLLNDSLGRLCWALIISCKII